MLVELKCNFFLCSSIKGLLKKNLFEAIVCGEKSSCCTLQPLVCFVSCHVIVIEITGCLPFTKIFQKIRLESKWRTTFWVVPLKISGSNGTSEKVVLFFWTEYSKRNFASHFVKAIFDTGFRPSRPFFLVINAIPGRNLRVLNFVYHLPRPWTDRFAHVNGPLVHSNFFLFPCICTLNL